MKKQPELTAQTKENLTEAFWLIVAEWDRTKLQTKFPIIANKLLKAPDPNNISL